MTLKACGEAKRSHTLKLTVESSLWGNKKIPPLVPHRDSFAINVCIPFCVNNEKPRFVKMITTNGDAAVEKVHFTLNSHSLSFT